MSKTMIPAQRRRKILEVLRLHQVASITDLVEMLGASEATIRRDLEWFESQGIAQRTHGGAVLTQRMALEPAYASSAQAHPEEKRRIGIAAAALVRDGETIFLNSGTTTTQVMHSLLGRSDLRDITVITNSVPVALAVPDTGFDVILLGGSFRPKATSVFGHFATGILRQVSADRAFIGVDGITLKFGYTTPVSGEAEVARGMIERTRGSVAVVADHSKWGVVSNFEIAPLEAVDTFVTDPGLAPEARSALEARSVHVRLADEKLPGGNGRGTR